MENNENENQGVPPTPSEQPSTPQQQANVPPQQVNVPPQQVNVPPQQPVNPQPMMGGGMQQTLPNSVGVLVMGICSIVFCFCYGIIGIVLAIIAMVLAGKAKVLYEANPNLYTESSFKNMKAGRICAIIGLILSAVYIVYIIILFAFIGTMSYGNLPWDNF